MARVVGNDIRGEGLGIVTSGHGAPAFKGNTVEVSRTAIDVRNGTPVIDGNAVCGGEGNIEVGENATPDIGDNEPR